MEFSNFHPVLIRLLFVYYFALCPYYTGGSDIFFLLGLIFTITLEWIVLDLPLQPASFKKLSIPFMVVVICLLRFLLETANFHQKEHTAQKGN